MLKIELIIFLIGTVAKSLLIPYSDSIVGIALISLHYFISYLAFRFFISYLLRNYLKRILIKEYLQLGLLVSLE